jgi:FkbM family methyltransferase
MPGLQRRVSDLLSGDALCTVRYIPRIVARVRNWPQFLITYMRLSDRPAVYRLRRGDTRILARSGVDVSTIAVIFIKEDYGADVGGRVIVDVGANIGVFALFAAADPEARVYAYEPVGATYGQLRQNVELNGLAGRVKTFNLGVTGRSERRAIHVSPHGSPFSTLYGGDGAPTEEIECVGLETVFAENGIDRCDLLKLDCEGAEFEILFGAPPEVLGRIGRICVEYHEQSDHPEFRRPALVEHLARQGFRVTGEVRDEDNCGTLWLVREGLAG